MNLEILTHAENFYQRAGFTKIEAPWLVDSDITDITLPKEKQVICAKTEKYSLGDLVGSAEQSFLQLVKNGVIKKGKYLATTPCFRDDPLDELHQKYFMKTELIDLQTGNLKTVFPNRQKDLKEMLKISLEFFNGYIPCEIIETEENCFDIIDTKNKIELGSYGIRETQIDNIHVSWVYGTGVAIPRLPYVIFKNKEIGYHKAIIRKDTAGTIGKIIEEVYELQDANMQGSKIMELAELSDIYGAIELYLTKNHPGIDMNDLQVMSQITKRAFENGRR